MDNNQQSGNPLFSEKALHLEGRRFSVRAQLFENGLFVSVSEGGGRRPRIGSLAVSLAPRAGAMPVTTTVIPPRDQASAFLMRMAAEQASSRSGGIAVVSVYVAGGELDARTSRALLGAVAEVVDHGKKGDAAGS